MTVPHVTAAFINSIAEEGSKEDAVKWLQQEWNENCHLRKLARLADEIRAAQRAYMADRGNQEKGQAVARAAEAYDAARKEYDYL